MRAADRLAGRRGAHAAARRRARSPSSRSRSAISLDPPGAVAAEVVQRGEQVRVVVVELVAEDVQVLVLAVHGRQLGGGGERDAVLARRGRAPPGTPSTVSWSVSASNSHARLRRRARRRQPPAARRLSGSSGTAGRKSAAWEWQSAGNPSRGPRGRERSMYRLIIAIVVVVLIADRALRVLPCRAAARRRPSVSSSELDQRRDAADRASQPRPHERNAAGGDGRAEGAAWPRRRPSASAPRPTCASSARRCTSSGMADHELVDDNERDQFAGTSRDARRPGRRCRDDERPMHEPTREYEQGRDDEAAARAAASTRTTRRRRHRRAGRPARRAASSSPAARRRAAAAPLRPRGAAAR